MQLRGRPNVFLAGQISGVEGYVESAAGGLLCALFLSQTLHGLPVTPPPPTTALGGIRTHLTRRVERYQPSNITWACLPPHENRRMKKRERYTALAERALVDLDAWLRDTAFAGEGAGLCGSASNTLVAVPQVLPPQAGVPLALPQLGDVLACAEGRAGAPSSVHSTGEVAS